MFFTGLNRFFTGPSCLCIVGVMSYGEGVKNPREKSIEELEVEAENFLWVWRRKIGSPA